MTVRDAAVSGDVRRTLEAIRDELAQALDDSEPSVKAQIAGQLRAVLADLRAISVGDAKRGPGVVTIDDAKAKREARQSAAQAAPDAKAGGRKHR